MARNQRQIVSQLLEKLGPDADNGQIREAAAEAGIERLDSHTIQAARRLVNQEKLLPGGIEELRRLKHVIKEFGGINRLEALLKTFKEMQL